MKHMRAWIVGLLFLSVLCLGTTALAAPVMDGTSLAAMRAMVGKRDYARTVTVLNADDSSATLDWLQHFSEDEIGYLVNTSEDLRQITGELSSPPISSAPGLAGLCSDIVALSNKTSYYLDTMEEARYRLSYIIEELEDPQVTWTSERKARYWQECEVLYQRLKDLNSELIGLKSGMESDCAALNSTLEQAEYQNLLSQGNTMGYLPKATLLTQQENDAANQEFKVVVLSDKEIGISAVTIVDKKPVYLEGAAVSAWNDEGKEFKGTTDVYGVVRFNIADFKPNESNKAWVKYYVSKAGYQSFGEDHVQIAGAHARNAVMAKDDGKPYASVCCFNGHDISRIKMDYYITPKNDAAQRFVVRVENLNKPYYVMMRYGSSHWGKAIAQMKVTPDQPTAVFSGTWAKDLPTGEQIWFYIIDDPGSWGAYKLLNTRFYTKNAIIKEPENPSPTLNVFANAMKSFGDKFEWFKKLNIDITPFAFRINAYMDVSGTAILQFGYCKAKDMWKTADQSNLDEVWAEIKKASTKDRNAMMHGMVRDSFRNRDKPLLGKLSASVTATGSLKGFYDPDSGKLSLDGGVAVKLGLNFDIKKTFWAGWVPFQVGADFGVSATLDVPVVQVNWNLKKAEFISAHFNVADSKASLQFQAGLSCGLGISGVAGVTIRGYATGTLVFKLREITRGPDSFMLGIGLEARAYILFASVTVTIGEAQWDLLKEKSSDAAFGQEQIVVLGAESAPTPEEIAAQTVTWDVTAQDLMNAGVDEIGGAYIEKKVADLTGSSGNMVQGWLTYLGNDTSKLYYYFVTMERVNVSGTVRSRLVINRITSSGSTLTYERQVIPMAQSLNVQDYSICGDESLGAGYRHIYITVIATLYESFDPNYWQIARFQHVGIFALWLDRDCQDRWSTLFSSRYCYYSGMNVKEHDWDENWLAHDPRCVVFTSHANSGEHVSEAFVTFCQTKVNEATNAIYGEESVFRCLMSYFRMDAGYESVGLSIETIIDKVARVPKGEIMYEVIACRGDDNNARGFIYTTGKCDVNGTQGTAPDQLHVFLRDWMPSNYSLYNFTGSYTSLRLVPSLAAGKALAYTRDIMCMEKTDKENGESTFALTRFSFKEGWEKPLKTVKKSYGITTNTPKMDLSPGGSQTMYVTWMNTAKKHIDEQGKETTRYQEMGARYDPKTDRFSEPFQFALTEKFPAEYVPLFIYKGANGNELLSIYTTLKDQSKLLKDEMNYEMYTHITQDAIKQDLLSASAYDPIVVAGEESIFYISVKNTGTLPISKFDVQFSCDQYPNWKPKLTIDCQNPLKNQVENQDSQGSITFVGDYRSMYPYRSSFDFEEGLYQTTTVTEYDENGRIVGEPLEDTKYYTMLMPSTTRSYNCKLQIPNDFKPTPSGKPLTIVAQIMNPCAISNPMVGMVSIVDGKQVALTAEEQPDEYITYQVTVQADGSRRMDVTSVSAEEGSTISSCILADERGTLTMPKDGAPYAALTEPVEADMAYNDLALEADLKYEPTLGYYIDAGVQAHSGLGSPTGQTSISINVDDDAADVWSYTFRNQLTERYGYSLIIPLDGMTGGKAFSQIELSVEGQGDYHEFDDNDNAVMMSNADALHIDQQPESIAVSVDDKASFSVQVSGGIVPYTYQWQMLSGDQWVDVSGGNASQYTLYAVKQEMIGRQYRCVITDAALTTVTSQAASLIARPPVTGDRQPVAGYLLLCLLAAAVGVAVIRTQRRENRL